MSMPDPMPSYDAQTPPATPPHPAPYAASAPEDAPLPGCGFARAVTRYWHGYVRFHGRASRGEYWWAVLFVAIVNVALNLLASLTDDAPLIGFLSFAWGVATILPSLAVSVRRLHDANGSGLLLLLPYGLILVGMLLGLTGLTGAAGGVVMLAAGGDAGLMGGGLGMTMVALLLLLAGLAALIILMCRPSDPNGARFDR